MVREALDERRVRLAFQPVVWRATPRASRFYEGLIRLLDPRAGRSPRAISWARSKRTEPGRRDRLCGAGARADGAERNPGSGCRSTCRRGRSAIRAGCEMLRRGLRGDPTRGRAADPRDHRSSAMLVPDIVIPFMAEMQARGIAFALDDFGAGFTAFRYFKRLLLRHGQDRRPVHPRRGHATPTIRCWSQALIVDRRGSSTCSPSPKRSKRRGGRLAAAAGVDCLQGYLFGAPTVQPRLGGVTTSARPRPDRRVHRPRVATGAAR